tara:strand:+ start:1180 stop:1602 length:423 start_codon:yes stop_codon:yes gene_type:complete
MKSGRIRTLRGQIEVTGGGVARKSLITEDGLINMGLKIERFQMWAVDPVDGFIGILSYDTIPSGSTMDAGDNRQFGWVVGNGTGDLNPTYLDPDHIINRDMFLSMEGSSNGFYNYLIEMRVYELSDDEAIVSIIKETSQS